MSLGNLFSWCISFPQPLLYSPVKWRKGEMNADYLNAFYNRKAFKSAQIVFEEESKTVFWNNRQTCSSTWRWLRTCNILPTEEKVRKTWTKSACDISCATFLLQSPLLNWWIRAKKSRCCSSIFFNVDTFVSYKWSKYYLRYWMSSRNVHVLQSKDLLWTIDTCRLVQESKSFA